MIVQVITKEPDGGAGPREGKQSPLQTLWVQGLAATSHAAPAYVFPHRNKKLRLPSLSVDNRSAISVTRVFQIHKISDLGLLRNLPAKTNHKVATLQAAYNHWLTVELISIKSNIYIHKVASFIWNSASVDSLVGCVEGIGAADLDGTGVSYSSYADVEGITRFVRNIFSISSNKMSNAALFWTRQAAEFSQALIWICFDQWVIHQCLICTVCVYPST